MRAFDLSEPDFRPLALAFSADGRALAAWGSGRVCVLDALSGAVLGWFGTPDPMPHEAPGVGFTADGRAVVAFRHGLRPPVQVYPLDPDAPVRACPKDHGFAFEVGRTGQFVYLTHDSAGQFRIVRWNPLSGKTTPGAWGRGDLRVLAVSADEQWVAGARGSNVRVWGFGGPEPAARAARQFKTANGAAVRALALASDGTFAAFRGPAVWFGAVGDGKVWTIAEAADRPGRDLAFHPSRPVLAYTAGQPEVVFYEVPTRTELKRFAWGVGQLRAVCFSADGLRCAAAARGKIVVWDVDL
ncbi:hypothetical protein GobsT_70500 [Gemmata obscuriglobus]|uniref:WD40 repeat domain-containing protein n=1 Tax=Gemmata obscuriglobus TaxID=114 RepID=A0A2Z3HDM5_9BACT|nr:hypothetical protein [Gemmata obscuriglobus]AWM41836.1 hypothetical protein C1280_35825 [Gemmata obscuriglobus]QEG32198.1 hypothetical protein GobsT_70500 [Gemmata obscuriglobus]VTS11551.1 wd-repeat protein : Uncultured bacterium genome assembly Metasoil_fosmids_resub OS=uncultured bacterium PE=4 SV=1 [Gemmata obscuriglobus UQM 2246]